MTALVTGTTGFISSHLAEHLLEVSPVSMISLSMAQLEFRLTTGQIRHVPQRSL